MHIVLDDTAMAAAGQGNVLASRLIHRAHAEADWFLYAPACALVEADRARPGTAEQLASLPGITVLDLDLAAALAVARQETWAAAHSQYAAQPTPGPSRRRDHRHHRPAPVGRGAGPRTGPHPLIPAADDCGPCRIRQGPPCVTARCAGDRAGRRPGPATAGEWAVLCRATVLVRGRRGAGWP